jgi:hypothetical protein
MAGVTKAGARKHETPAGQLGRLERGTRNTQVMQYNSAMLAM